MERLKRYNKKVTLAIVMSFVVAVTGILSTSFQSKAVGQSSDLTFYVSYPQPYCSDTTGYVSVVYRTATNNYLLNTLFWSMEPETNEVFGTDFTNVMDITLTNNTIRLDPFVLGGSYWYNLYEFTSSDYLGRIHTGYYNSVSGAPSWSYSYYGEVVAVLFNGNVASFNTGGVDLKTPVIHWSNSSDSNQIYNYMWQILQSLQGVEGDTTEIISKLNSILLENVSTNQKLEDIKALYEQLIEEQQESNTWLEKIWNSIQEFFNPSEEDKTESEQFDSETTEKSDEIGGLVEESTTNKPDVDEMSNSIDSNLDMTSANEYGAVLLNITENEYIIQMLLIVVTVAIIAYVLFGKR